jgi:mono/diheme cytochrome c family protein
MTRSLFFRMALAVAMTAVLTGGGTVRPVAAEEKSNGRVAEGDELYRKYCGACHGLAGEGDGVVSGLMQPPPTDLTVIARKNGGEFPFKHVMDQTDGTIAIRAHGDPDMPVWGEVLAEPTHQDGMRRADVQGRVFLIIKHIESIQKK